MNSDTTTTNDVQPTQTTQPVNDVQPVNDDTPKAFVPGDDDYVVMKMTHRNRLRIKVKDPLKWKVGFVFPIEGEKCLFEVVSKTGSKAVVKQLK